MGGRWSAEQVLAVAPDATSARAGRSLSRPGPWGGTGSTEVAVWGDCRGSGTAPYRVVVDVTGPAYRCSCPSRKFPCKHALGLLLLWSAGEVPEAEPTAWVSSWLTERAQRRTDAAPRSRTKAAPKDPQAAAAGAAQRAARREERVTAGLEELDRWLHDQVRQGLARLPHEGYRVVDRVAARLVDAQAPGAAGTVRRLAGVTGSGADWAGRALEELGLLHLLAEGWRRRAELSTPLAETVRTRVGFTRSRESLLAGQPRVRDTWQVLGSRDEVQDHLQVRRTWLRGRATGRDALVLSFAVGGQSLDVGLVPGTAVETDLAFYPAALPLRALPVTEAAPVPAPHPPRGTDVAGAAGSYAAALAADPFVELVPVVLSDVRPARDGEGWAVVDTTGDAVRLVGGDPWPLLGASGGEPVAVFGEWGPRGLRVLSLWGDDGMVPA
jgi:SWIM zinc finger